jgi:hypothetical protein
MFTEYTCQTCGLVAAMSADQWQWHRLVAHPQMGLPAHRPNRKYMAFPADNRTTDQWMVSKLRSPNTWFRAALVVVIVWLLIVIWFNLNSPS